MRQQFRGVGGTLVPPTPLIKAVERLSKRQKADIFLYSAPMNLMSADKLRDLVCQKSPREENCIIFITTFGGDADTAYRLASCLRRNYKSVSAFVFGLCKSAGTLAVLGADEIVFGDLGELGPLDVQMTKPDELMSTSSGLDIFQAMGVLTNSAFEAFENYFLSIIEHSQGHISAKTSAEIARELAVGLFAPMTGQIDPERLGEVQRAITVANAYGSKLDKRNLKRNALEKLVQGYPTHGFVIDIEEARTLFVNVRVADPLERQVASALPGLRRQGPEPCVIDVRKFFSSARGTKHVQPKTARKPRRAVPAASGERPSNVSQLKRDTSGHAATTEEDNNSGRSTAGKAVRSSSKKSEAAGGG